MVFNKLNWLYKKQIIVNRRKNASNNLVLVNYYNAFELQNINLIRIKTLKVNNSLLLLTSVKGY